ncbi:radical SAM protein [Peptostreptococcus faecalis]|uniref:radical SAM protein n=1 Tax=Peptostreptococcus faecalis TaxID=2045015 RepID=UPI000C7DA25F|nr:radical SAM protein [Peptostreptococcus faecalis]
MDEHLSYLRLILTEENNYPVMYSKPIHDVKILSQEEQSMKLEDYKKIINFFSKRELKKIKFVGGEPLLYKHLDELVLYAKESGIEEIGITTNGIGLGTRILDLKKAGLTHVNISLDSLKEYKYQALTGGANLKEVFISIDACQAAGINLKINCVAIKDFNDDELIDFMRLTINNNMDVRLIELLPHNLNKHVYERGYMDLKEYMENTEDIYRSEDENLSVTEYFKINGAIGRVGIITTDSREYKEDLRRINISNRGYMNVGSLQENEYFIKPDLDNEDKLEDLFYNITSNI